jgi:hypothetical protein
VDELQILKIVHHKPGHAPHQLGVRPGSIIVIIVMVEPISAVPVVLRRATYHTAHPFVSFSQVLLLHPNPRQTVTRLCLGLSFYV